VKDCRSGESHASSALFEKPFFVSSCVVVCPCGPIRAALPLRGGVRRYFQGQWLAVAQKDDDDVFFDTSSPKGACRALKIIETLLRFNKCSKK
jgi:hypothetical protein